MHDLWVLIPAMTLLHRARGAGQIGPGRSLWYWTPVLLALCLSLGLPWPSSAVIALGYLIWATPAWSRWMGEIWGVAQPDGPLTWDQEIFERIGFGNPDASLSIRFALMLLPLTLGLTLLGRQSLPMILVPLAILPAVRLAGRVRPSDPYMVEELITGAAWGVGLFLSLMWVR